MIDYTTYSDEELVVLIKEKPPLCDKAFYILYHRFRSKLFAYCLFLTNDRQSAADLFQESWLKFVQNVRQGKKIEKALPYLIGIARISFYYDKRIKDKHLNIISENQDSIIEELMQQGNVFNKIENDELISLIKIAVQNLDDIYKEAFVLKRFNELDYESMAKICGVSVACIKKRVARATLMVKDLLKPYIVELQ